MFVSQRQEASPLWGGALRLAVQWGHNPMGTGQHHVPFGQIRNPSATDCDKSNVCVRDCNTVEIFVFSKHENLFLFDQEC